MRQTYCAVLPQSSAGRNSITFGIVHLYCTNDEVAAVGLAVAAGQTDHESLLKWVREHRA